MKACNLIKPQISQKYFGATLHKQQNLKIQVEMLQNL